MKNRVVSETGFQAKCLACIDEIEQLGGTITIARRGRPVAVLGFETGRPRKSPRNSWAGKARIVGDIMKADTSGLWGCSLKVV